MKAQFNKCVCVFSKCSVECGEGIQRRAVTCHRVNSYGWIDPTPTEGCPMDQKPVENQICKLRECSDKYYWVAGTWRKVNAFSEFSILIEADIIILYIVYIY